MAQDPLVFGAGIVYHFKCIHVTLKCELINMQKKTACKVLWWWQLRNGAKHKIEQNVARRKESWILNGQGFSHSTFDKVMRKMRFPWLSCGFHRNNDAKSSCFQEKSKTLKYLSKESALHIGTRSRNGKTLYSYVFVGSGVFENEIMTAHQPRDFLTPNGGVVMGPVWWRFMAGTWFLT